MSKLQLLPFPKSIKHTTGKFNLTKSKGILLPLKNSRLQTAAVKLQNNITAICGKQTSKSNKPNIILKKDKLIQSQAYRLNITEKSIFISAGKAVGFFYGIQTLKQIIKQSGKNLPCLMIEDEPDFAVRGFYHDITRGKVPKLETVFELIDKLAFYKINQLQLYVEHTFAFKNHADLWQGADPFTAEDIKKIDKYCYENFIDCVPSLSTFGHCYTLINSPVKQHLNELDINASEKAFSWYERMAHYTLDCQNPESLELMSEMITEYAGLFRSKYFNICCDETFDLGKGKNAKLAEKLGTGKLYVDFVRKLISVVQDCGKQPMFWGDILHKYPESLDNIPDDAVVLNWSYDPKLTHGDCQPFANAGLEYYVCPGVSGWNQWLPKMNHARKNISRFAKEGKKHGATGLLNTDWGDFGHINALSLSMHGVSLGAACSWDAAHSNGKEFDQSFALLEYGQKSSEIIEILTKAGDLSVVSWHAISFSFDKGIPNDWLDAKTGIADVILTKFNDIDLDKIIRKLTKLRTQLLSIIAKNPQNNALCFQEMDCAIWGEILQHKTAWLFRLKAGLETAPEQFSAIDTAAEWSRFEQSISKLWHIKNRPSEYFRIKLMIGEIIKMLESCKS